MSASKQNHGRGKKQPKPLKDKGLKVSGPEEIWISNLSSLIQWESFLTAVRGRSPATVKRYRGLVERALRDTERTVATLDRPAIEGHLKRLYLTGRGASVRQGVVAALRGFFEWAMAQGLVRENPTTALSGPRPYRREIKVLTPHEIRSLIWPGGKIGIVPRNPQEHRDRTLLAVAYIAGLRASEIGPLETAGLRWDDRTQTFSILVGESKNARGDRRLPLDRQVSRLVGSYVASANPGRYLWGRPLTRSAIRKILHRMVEASGIAAGGRRMSPHILRHSLATHLLKKHDIRAVQVFMRHRSIATTEVYLHVDEGKMAMELARRSPLEEGRTAPRTQLRPALQELLGELRGIVPAGK